MREHEQQTEMDLGPTERLGGFMDEIRLQEARKKRIGELGVEACRIIEEVYEAVEKVKGDLTASDIGEILGERLKPIRDEVRKIRGK